MNSITINNKTIAASEVYQATKKAGKTIIKASAKALIVGGGLALIAGHNARKLYEQCPKETKKESARFLIGRAWKQVCKAATIVDSYAREQTGMEWAIEVEAVTTAVKALEAEPTVEVEVPAAPKVKARTTTRRRPALTEVIAKEVEKAGKA